MERRAVFQFFSAPSYVLMSKPLMVMWREMMEWATDLPSLIMRMNLDWGNIAEILCRDLIANGSLLHSRGAASPWPSAMSLKRGKLFRERLQFIELFFAPWQQILHYTWVNLHRHNIIEPSRPNSNNQSLLISQRFRSTIWITSASSIEKSIQLKENR